FRAMSAIPCDHGDSPPPYPLCSSHLIPGSPIRSRPGITWDRQQRVTTPKFKNPAPSRVSSNSDFFVAQPLQPVLAHVAQPPSAVLCPTKVNAPRAPGPLKPRFGLWGGGPPRLRCPNLCGTGSVLALMPPPLRAVRCSTEVNGPQASGSR